MTNEASQRTESAADASLEQQAVYLAEQLFADHPLNRPGHSLAFRESLLTCKGMLEIIEAMRQRKFRARLECLDDPVLTLPWLAAFDPPKGMNITHDGKTLPKAVVRAAFEALQADRSD